MDFPLSHMHSYQFRLITFQKAQLINSVASLIRTAKTGSCWPPFSPQNMSKYYLQFGIWSLKFGILFLLIFDIIPTNNALKADGQAFERFVSRQNFPLPEGGIGEGGDNEHTFRPNCTVPICEGPLAPIFCSGSLISSAWYFGVQGQCPGSKLSNEPRVVMNNFKRIVRDREIKKGDFLQFCQENFENVPYLKPANLSDWRPNPATFLKIYNQKMRKFATVLHEIWPSLTREFIDDVDLHQDRYPVLHVPHRFVVPGGFFKLYFYWDTYWILKGLYFSNLIETAHGMLENFAHLLRFHGFIPNSGNVQLSRRSQPPLFTQMIADFYNATRNKTFLAEFLPRAEWELSWWNENRTVELVQWNGQNHTLFRYRAVTDCPRPENFLEDYQLGRESASPMFFWSSTASACESGLDFSSRWYRWGTAPRAMNRTAIATNRVVPVDLNVFMALNYRTLGRLYGELGNQSKHNEYTAKADALRATIDAVFMDAETGAWFDFDLPGRRLRPKFYPSNIYPLLLNGDERLKKMCPKAVEYLKHSGALGFHGGIPASLEHNSNEQWDFPNGWAPQQHLFVLSLLECQRIVPEAAGIARTVADAFLTTAYNGMFSPTKGKPAQIWEKYDVRFDNGQPGFGGEYPAQSGFGWTNGVIFEFIRMFYTSEKGGGERANLPNNENADRESLLALETVSALLQTIARETLF